MALSTSCQLCVLHKYQQKVIWRWRSDLIKLVAQLIRIKNTKNVILKTTQLNIF